MGLVACSSQPLELWIVSILFVLFLPRSYPLNQHAVSDNGMFTSYSEQWLDHLDVNQKNYGVAVADVDFDGDFEFIVAGFTGPNMVLKYNRDLDRLDNIAKPGTPFEALMDPGGQALGICACDIDGNGQEEIYILNSNHAYAGMSMYGDKLLIWRDGKYVDLYQDPVNRNVTAKNYAGRSVACLDRYGRGKYGFILATYAQGSTGNFSLIEMDEFHHDNDIDSGKIVLCNNAKESGIERSTGGRGIAVGPILNGDGRLDIFFDNEGNNWLGNYGGNYLFQNIGNGSFIEVAEEYGLGDENESGRGVALADFNNDGLLDIVYGNYEGYHRLYIQTFGEEGKWHFIDIATPDFAKPSAIRNLIVADFDNDKHQEVFMNNINDYGISQPNRLYRVTSYGPTKDPGISMIPIGDAVEDDGFGTGAAVADIDGDGMLDLLTSHGEDASQPLDIYQVSHGQDNNWIRFLVKTKYGAPARGASVNVFTKSGIKLTRIIDSGSGYLCQMEPVAHFGLGSDGVKAFMVKWPDGRFEGDSLEDGDMRKVHVVEHPDAESIKVANEAANLSSVITPAINHTEL